MAFQPPSSNNNDNSQVVKFSAFQPPTSNNNDNSETVNLQSINHNNPSNLSFSNHNNNTTRSELKESKENDTRDWKDAIVQLTIKQIINCAENDTQVFLDNVEKISLEDRGRLISAIFLMATVIKIDNNGNLAIIKAHDYTGTILIKTVYYDSTRQLFRKLAGIKTNTWYRFFCQIKIKKKKTVELILFDYWEIIDKMEIAYQGLNMIYQDMYLNLSLEEKTIFLEHNKQQQKQYEQDFKAQKNK